MVRKKSGLITVLLMMGRWANGTAGRPTTWILPVEKKKSSAPSGMSESNATELAVGISRKRSSTSP